MSLTVKSVQSAQSGSSSTTRRQTVRFQTTTTTASSSQQLQRSGTAYASTGSLVQSSRVAGGFGGSTGSLHDSKEEFSWDDARDLMASSGSLNLSTGVYIVMG
eukprot:sb/3478181/